MIAVVCHDAGGAELVSSFVRREGGPWRAALAGPAVSVFARKLMPVASDSLTAVVAGADRLICGTSWPATLEWEALGLARDHSVPSVAILDHWVNYRRRFVRDGVLRLPDEVWVCDAAAHARAVAELPEARVRQIDNPYRQDVLEALQAIPAPSPASGRSVLYVTEPTADAATRLHGDPRYWGYTEEEALRGFLTRLAVWGPVREVVVRPHPTEDAAKYRWVEDDFPGLVRVSDAAPLLEQLTHADLVAGCNSMAMVVATWAGKPVVCAIPPGGSGFALPTEGIAFLADVWDSSGTSGRS